MGSTVKTRCPSSDPVRMWAVVAVPSPTLPLTVKRTKAWPLSSATSDTVPTLIPDTVTSLPATSPPACVNSASYLIAVAHDTNCSGRKPTAMMSTINTSR